MDTVKLQALWNAALLVDSLEPGEMSHLSLEPGEMIKN